MIETYASRADWLAARRGSLGASDIARAFTGRVSEFALWAEKTGRIEPEFPPLLSDFGLALEPVCRKWTLEALNLANVPAEAGGLSERPHWWPHQAAASSAGEVLLVRGPEGIHASPDTLLSWGDNAPRGLVQHKTIDRMQSWKVESGPEEYAWTQVQAELLCAPYIERAWVSYLVGNGYDADRDFKVYEIHADKSFQDRILAFARGFAEHVKSDTPPDPGNLDDVHEVLAAMFPPRPTRRFGLLPAEHGPDVERWRQIDRAVDELAREKQGIRNRLEYAMAQAELEEAVVAIDEYGPTTKPTRLLRTARKDGVVVFRKKEPNE